MKQVNSYLKVVEWSSEDGCYIGSAPGLMLGGVHGDNEQEVYKELCAVVEEWIDLQQKEGVDLPAATANKGYSGKFVLRVGADIHKALVIRALQEGESLNRYCNKVLAKAV